MKANDTLSIFRNCLSGIVLWPAAALILTSVCSAQLPVSNNFATTSAYLAILGRDPDPAGWIYWAGTLPGSPSSSAQQQLYASFLVSNEYTTRYGSPDPAEFVTYLYQDALLRNPDLDGLNYWEQQLPPYGTITEADVAAYIISGTEYGGNANGQYANTYQTANVTIGGMSQGGTGQVGSSLQTVSIAYTNPLNTSSYSDIASGDIFIGPDPSASTGNGCYVQWFSNNTFVLYDGASNYTGTSGSGTSLSGVYCTLVLYTGTTVVRNSNGYTVTLALTYNAAMGNADGSVANNPVWTSALNNEGLATGWTNEGSVSVSQPDFSVSLAGSPQALTYVSVSPFSVATFVVTCQLLNGYTGTIDAQQPDLGGGSAFLYASIFSTGQPCTWNVTVTYGESGQYNPGGNTPGIYDGSVTLSIPGGPQHTVWFEVDLVPAATFTVSPVPPASQSIGASGEVSYQLMVPSNGFPGTISFTNVTGLPSTVSWNFSPSGGVHAGQSTTLSLTVGSGTPPGTYTATVSASSGSSSATGTVTLIVAGPASIFMPPPQTNGNITILPGGSTTFAWTTAVGATDYQLQLTSSDNSVHFNGSPTTSTSATVVLPSGTYTLYASLGTLTGGSWQSNNTSYSVNSQAQFTPPVLTANQQPVSVPMNNLPVFQTLTFVAGDARTIQSCLADDVAFRVRIVSATQNTLTLAYTATPQAAPVEPIGCTCPGGPIDPPPPPPGPVPPPSIQDLSITQAATGNAPNQNAPLPEVTPLLSTSTDLAFATDGTGGTPLCQPYANPGPCLISVLMNSPAVSVTAENLQGTSLTIQWRIDEDSTDALGLHTISPSPASGSTTSFPTTAAGNFRLAAWVDLNGNGAFDPGEQLGTVYIAVVQVTGNGTAQFTLANTLYQYGPENLYTLVQPNTYPMSLQAAYLIQGGGATGKVGTGAIIIGNIGNFVGDTFKVTYQPQGTEAETLATGLQTPLVDTSNFSGNQTASGGASVFRANSSITAVATSDPGILLQVNSVDGPTFVWDATFSNTTNPWLSTQGGNSFREFIAAFSRCFANTYVSYSLAGWAIAAVGYNASGEWSDSGSSVTGSTGLGAVGTAQVQVLGQSVFKNLTMVAQQ